MSTQADLVDRLRTVTDPCSLGMRAPIDIWSLGLVEDVAVTGRTALVRLVLTDPSCVFFRGISEHVATALRALPDIDAVEVELDTTILWTPDRMKKGA
jgi:metal-sulfur cluster biosynthetic enzyme